MINALEKGFKNTNKYILFNVFTVFKAFNRYYPILLLSLKMCPYKKIKHICSAMRQVILEYVKTTFHKKNER